MTQQTRPPRAAIIVIRTNKVLLLSAELKESPDGKVVNWAKKGTLEGEAFDTMRGALERAQEGSLCPKVVDPRASNEDFLAKLGKLAVEIGFRLEDLICKEKATPAENFLLGSSMAKKGVTNEQL